MRNELKALSEQISTRDNNVNQRAQLSTQTNAYVNAFREKEPAYDAALNHFMQGRAQELALWGVAKADIPGALKNEAEQLSYQAIQAGQDPAQMIWDMAKTRGFTPKKGGKATATVESITQGQDNSQTLAGTSGGEDDVSLVDVSKMTEKEFDAYWDKMTHDATPRY